MRAGERGAEPHVHLHHVDAFYVLSGEMTLRVGPDARAAHRRSRHARPRPARLVHGFDNDSDGEVRFLNFHAPGCNFVEYLRGRGEFDQAAAAGRRRPPGLGCDRHAAGRRGALPARGPRDHDSRRAAGDLGAALEVEPMARVPGHDHDDQVDASSCSTARRGSCGRRDRAAAAGRSTWRCRARATASEPWRARPLLNVHGPDAGFAEDVRSQ